MHTLGDRSLFFLHIPKTAGTSLRELLSCRFAPADILALLRSDGREERAQQLADVAQYRFVHGHVPYALVDRFPRRPFVVTLLRDPLDRAVSAFYDMRRQARTLALTDAGLGRPARARDYAAAARMPLAEFVRDAPPAASRHLGNLQVSFLASGDVNERFEYSDDYRISISRADLERAKARLAACECVGITERMVESIELLAYALATAPLGEVSSANRTPGRPSIAELDDDTVAALRDLTAWDRELYTFACELFEDRRRGMTRRLLSRQAEAGHAAAVNPGPARRQVFTFEGPVPGAGWYAPQRAGDRWFSWTGPTCASSIELASPHGTAFALRLGVLHTMSPELLSALDLRINDVPIHPSAARDADGHVITAGVPRDVIRAPGESNVIAIRLPTVVRPCDLDGANPDSRLLGIAVHRIELMAI